MTDDHVHRYRTSITWEPPTGASTGAGYQHYVRQHRAVAPPATAELSLTSDVAFGGDPALLNPEQLLVLSASSCQLLSFLAVAARARLDVVSYLDDAEGEMPEQKGAGWVSRIVLRPRVVVAVPEASDAGAPDGTGTTLHETASRDASLHDASSKEAALRDKVRHLLDVAHHECYIANSLRTEIVLDPVITVVPTSKRTA